MHRPWVALIRFTCAQLFWSCPLTPIVLGLESFPFSPIIISVLLIVILIFLWCRAKSIFLGGLIFACTETHGIGVDLIVPIMLNVLSTFFTYVLCNLASLATFISTILENYYFSTKRWKLHVSCSQQLLLFVRTFLSVSEMFDSKIHTLNVQKLISPWNFLSAHSVRVNTINTVSKKTGVRLIPFGRFRKSKLEPSI